MLRNGEHVREDPREKLLKILNFLKDSTSLTGIKFPRNHNLLIRKIYKYIKPNTNIIKTNFLDLEQLDKDKLK